MHINTSRKMNYSLAAESIFAITFMLTFSLAYLLYNNRIHSSELTRACEPNELNKLCQWSLSSLWGLTWWHMNKDPVLKAVVMSYAMSWALGDSHSWPWVAPCSVHCGWRGVPLQGGHMYGLGWTGWSWAQWSTASASALVQFGWSVYAYVCQRKFWGQLSSHYFPCLCPWLFHLSSALLRGLHKHTGNKVLETMDEERKTNQPQVL